MNQGKSDMAPDRFWGLAPEGKVEITPGEVHVWWADFQAPLPDLSRFLASLSPQELSRAERFRRDLHRGRFIARRGFLRSVLSAYLGGGPADVIFEVNSFGKPSVPSSAWLNFNLSHSEGCALVAAAVGGAVGIDIERARGRGRELELARSFFSRLEARRLLELPPAAREEAFFTCWTRKEAYVKARGTGLTLPLASFSVTLGPGEPPALLRSDEGPGELARWEVLDLPEVAGFAAALVAEKPVRDLRCWLWPGLKHCGCRESS